MVSTRLEYHRAAVLTGSQGNYTVKPYNFFLDPVPNEKLNVERIFAYQSGGWRPVSHVIKNFC